MRDDVKQLLALQNTDQKIQALEAVADVAIGEVGSSHERLVGDRDPVVRLVLVADALEDLDGVRERGLLHLHRLEATFERGILLHVLAELLERRGADAMQLAARQRRLEHVAGIDGPLGLARTDHGVQLVDPHVDKLAEVRDRRRAHRHVRLPALHRLVPPRERRVGRQPVPPRRET